MHKGYISTVEEKDVLDCDVQDAERYLKFRNDFYENSHHLGEKKGIRLLVFAASIMRCLWNYSIMFRCRESSRERSWLT